MNERQLINKIHRTLDKRIYRWKINDSYHGGVPDTYYAGPAGLCFVEYKYKPNTPKKGTSKMNFLLTDQQQVWLTQQREYKVPVFVLAGCKEHFIFTQEFERINGCTKDELLKNSISLKEYIAKIEKHCLGNK